METDTGIQEGKRIQNREREVTEYTEAKKLRKRDKTQYGEEQERRNNTKNKRHQQRIQTIIVHTNN